MQEKKRIIGTIIFAGLTQRKDGLEESIYGLKFVSYLEVFAGRWE